MSPQLKKILVIVGFGVAVGVMFWIIYLVFFRTTTTSPGDNLNQVNINGLPQPTNGNVNQAPSGNINGLPVTNTPVTGPNRVANGGATIADAVVPNSTTGVVVGPNGELLYYDYITGKFYRISPDGTSKSSLSDAVYKDVQSIVWAPTGNRAVLTFPDNSKIMYDFDRKKQFTLPPELSEFTFSPHGDFLASKYLDSRNADNQWLMVTQADGTGAQTVEQLGENARKVTTTWSPNNNVIAAYEKSVTSDLSEVIFLGRNGENLPSTTIEGRGFIPNWSPDGNRLLYSSYSSITDNAPHLYLMDGSAEGLGKNIIDLDLDTRADKCAFSQDNYTLYCAVPFYPVTDSGPRPSLGFSVPDNIYAIDILRGTKTLIARPVDENQRQRYSIGSISLSGDETSLYFTDVQTGYIHRVLLR